MLSSLSSSISNARQSIAQVLNFALVLSTAFMMVRFRNTNFDGAQADEHKVEGPKCTDSVIVTDCRRSIWVYGTCVPKRRFALFVGTQSPSRDRRSSRL
jgi:hypothetical protein